MKNFLPALVLLASCASTQRAPSSAAVTRYCTLGISTPHFLSDAEVTRVSEEDRAGKLDASVFQMVWSKSCDYDVSLEVAEGVKGGKLYPGIFLHFVYPAWSGSCNSIQRTIEPKAAKDIAFAVGAHEADPGAVEESFKRFCDAPFALQIGRDVKAQHLDLADLQHLATGQEACFSVRKTLSHEQIRDVAYAAKEGKLTVEGFLKAWRESCDFGVSWAQTAGAD